MGVSARVCIGDSEIGGATYGMPGVRAATEGSDNGGGGNGSGGLAVVVIGGLFTSTLLTLVLLPTLYAWIEGRAQRRLAQPTTEDHA